MQRRRPSTAILLSGLLGGCLAGQASAADQFTYTMRREVHAVDTKSGAEIPFSKEQVGSANRRTLGVTGRIAIARRTVFVDEGGQVFVHATVPEALAGQPHDLDVLVEGNDGMRVRGSIPYQPGSNRKVARIFVIPELSPGPALTEVHVRGAHVGDWQEIATEQIDVPKKGRLRFGYSLEGATAKSPALDLVVEARPADGEGKTVTLMNRKVSGGSSGWEEETADLSKLAGRRVQLAFRSRPAGGDSATAPGVVWGAPSVEVDEKRRAYPIVVLVSLDSLRASSVGLYTGGGATPFLDGFFGREGAIMTQAVSQAVTTLPSHMTLMTGLNPLSHGVIDETRSLGPTVSTLAEQMRAKGWHTVAFTEGGALAGELGFRRGFDVYDEGDSGEIAPASSDSIQRATEWLDDYSGAPLFLFVHSYATRPVHTGVNAVEDPSARERHLASYVEQVRRVDNDLRTFFETMKGRIDEDDSIYVVTSGHGDEFFEHGAVGHGTHLYDETTRVPLLLRSEDMKRRGRQSQVVGLIDVAPTILEMAGVKTSSGMQGRSFARLLQSGKDVDQAPRYSEARRPVRLTSAGQLLLWGPPAYSIREGSYKVIWNSGGDESFEAYDLAKDPRESRDLVRAGRPPEWVRRLAGSLKNYPGVAERGARGRGGKADLSPANRARLESLGYAR